ncbi:MAG: hypothetical protein AABX47_08315 [Nanoarchaeota archaeon]
MPTNPAIRLTWYATLNWIILILLYGMTIAIAGEAAVTFVMSLAHLGVVPMLTHHFLRKYEGDRTRGSWTIGLAFGLIGLALDAATFGWYLGRGQEYFFERMTYVYFAMRIGLAPITAKWIEPHMGP